MTLKIDSLSPKELDALIQAAKKQKSRLAKRKPLAVVRKKLAAMLKAEGYTAEEVFGGTPSSAAPKAAAKAKAPRSRKSLGKVPPKFRNPDNPAETWTGRGKQPRWLAAFTAAGRSVDEFLIQG